MKTALVIGATGAAIGGSTFWHRGMVDGQLTEHGTAVLRGLARGVVGTMLPKDPAARQALLDGHVKKIGFFLNNLPPALRTEINALLGLLANPPTRYLMTGLSQNWEKAADEDIVKALEYMRLNALPTTQLAYHAVRDITCVTFFSSSDSWSLVGYPGPVTV